MGTEIPLFLKYLEGTHSGSGAVLGSGEAKVNEVDSDCKEYPPASLQLDVI